MPKYWVKNYFAHGEIPRSGSKAKDGEKRRRRAKVGNNNVQLRIVTPPQVANAKLPGPTSFYTNATTAIINLSLASLLLLYFKQQSWY